jgi:DNA-binding PadR family transcriptional regulator
LIYYALRCILRIIYALKCIRQPPSGNFATRSYTNAPMALSHALLATLHDSPLSGYDLAKRFDGSVGFFWSATHQQIYRELSKLEEQGYATVLVVEQSSRPDKKVYTTTAAGREYLGKWIAKPDKPPAFKDDLMVKLFAGDLVEPSVMLGELKHHYAQHQKLLATYKMVKERAFPDSSNLPLKRRYQYLTLRRGITLENEWLAWYAEAIEILSEIIEVE